MQPLSFLFATTFFGLTTWFETFCLIFENNKAKKFVHKKLGEFQWSRNDWSRNDQNGREEMVAKRWSRKEVANWSGRESIKIPLTAHYCRLSERRIILCKEMVQNCACSLYKVQLIFSIIEKLVWLCAAASHAATINVCMVKWAVWNAIVMAIRPMNRPTSTFSSSKLNF